MATFVWKEDYCVGDAAIDAQHQYIFALANDMVVIREKDQLTRYAMQLFRYVREHFDHEEAVMRKAAYPQYQEHLALHESLITQLSELSQGIAADQWSAAGLQCFMTQWLLVHIVDEDTKLAKFLLRDQPRAA